MEHPGVRDALVVGLPDERWGHRIAAVVAAASPGGVTAPELAGHVGARLAAYKKPRSIVFAVQAIQRSPGRQGRPALGPRRRSVGRALTTAIKPRAVADGPSTAVM